MRRILTRTNPMPDLVAMSNLVFTAPAAFSLASSSSLERLSDPPPSRESGGCDGTIALYTDLRNEVILLYLNNGEWPAAKGGAPANVRMAEASKACQILTARPAYAGQFNGQAVLDSAHFDEYRKILEAERPDVVLTQWPIHNHRDHRATSALTYDAWVQMGRSFALYYYEVSNGEDTLQFSPTQLRGHHKDRIPKTCCLLRSRQCYARQVL